MGASARLLALTPASHVAAATVLASFLLGALIAYGLPIGLGLLLAFLYGLLVMTHFTLGLAVWVCVAFLEALPLVERGVQGAGLLLAFAWLGAFSSRREDVLALLRRHPRLLAVLALFLVWITVSGAWAQQPYFGVRLWEWHVAAVVFLIIATSVTTERSLRLVAGAFVAGVLLSMLLGLGGTPVGAGLPYLEGAADSDGRLSGGLGDPNFMAAAIVAAIILAGGLAVGARNWAIAAALLAVIPVLTLGLVATQSRGGLVAAAAAILAGLAVFRGRRIMFGLFVVCMVSVGALMFSAAPPEFSERIERATEDGGTGRLDLWRVAWEIGKDYPIIGVGHDNFSEFSPRYVNELDSVDAADYISEERLVVHNPYLELLAETGVVGLSLFLAFALACLLASGRAVKRLEALAEPRLTVLAQAVLVATIAMLVARFFVSGGSDEGTWVLLALGPAMLTLAIRMATRLSPLAFGQSPARARAVSQDGAPAHAPAVTSS